MAELLTSLGDLIVAAWGLLKALGSLALTPPWLPLAAWIAFWLCAVNWTKFRDLLIHKGGLLGLILIAAVTALIWGVVDPEPHQLLGLSVSNFVGKIVYVTGFLCLMFLCGSVQLSGCCQQWCEPDLPSGDSHGHGGHGHGGHDSHGHDSHGEPAHAHGAH